MVKRLEFSNNDKSSYVYLEDEVIVEAGFCGEIHSKSNQSWAVAAKAVLSLHKEENKKYNMLLMEMRRTAFEYHKLKEAIKLILAEDNECKNIMAEL